MARRVSAHDEDRDDAARGDGGPIEAATLIAQSLAELAQLAHRHQLDVLRFLLDMAVLEARDILRNRNAEGPR